MPAVEPILLGQEDLIRPQTVTIRHALRRMGATGRTCPAHDRWLGRPVAFRAMC